MARIVPATKDWIQEAAEVILSGGLVAFPTETVYGLGANALDETAVAKIFEAKGRPSTNPIIVHIARFEQLDGLCLDFPDSAQELAQCYWPGPLTMVLPKSKLIPDIVSAGGSTVGIRIPDHPVALALLELCGVPIAAPSANRSEEISPTTAQHVADSLGDFIDLILDGGPCDVGIESTVLDLSGEQPRILRPGDISIADIEITTGEKVMFGGYIDHSGISRSPGQMLRHYSPGKPANLIPRHARTQLDLQMLGLSLAGDTVRIISIDAFPRTYANQMYSALRDLDAQAEIASILIEEPPDTREWAAVRDRLNRAAAPRD